jgi:hypothetical protein
MTKERFTNDASQRVAASQQSLTSAASANAVESGPRMSDAPPTGAPNEANDPVRVTTEPPRDEGVMSNPDF